MRKRDLEERLREVMVQGSANGLAGDEVFSAMSDLLRANVEVKDQTNNRQCIAREICMRSIKGSFRGENKLGFKELLFQFQLLFLGLDDRSLNFQRFIERAPRRDLTSRDCIILFPDCGLASDYEFRKIKF